MKIKTKTLTQGEAKKEKRAEKKQSLIFCVSVCATLVKESEFKAETPKNAYINIQYTYIHTHTHVRVSTANAQR